MSGSIKQFKTTGSVFLSKFNLKTTEFANPDSRKLAGFDVARVAGRKMVDNLSKISKENHLSKKKEGSQTIQAS